MNFLETPEGGSSKQPAFVSTKDNMKLIFSEIVPCRFNGRLRYRGPTITAPTEASWQSLTPVMDQDSNVMRLSAVGVSMSIDFLRDSIKSKCERRRNQNGLSYLGNSIYLLASDIVAYLNSGVIAYPLGIIFRARVVSNEFAQLTPDLLLIENDNVVVPNGSVCKILYEYNGPNTVMEANGKVQIVIGFPPTQMDILSVEFSPPN